MHSCIYRGTVYHRRYQPQRHEFQYSLYMLFLDLSELDQVFRQRLGWSYQEPSLHWCRRIVQPALRQQTLETGVREFIQSQTGIFPLGPIRVLTQVRQFGFLMNPVAFFFVYAADSEDLQYVVAEVNNTPWNEEHRYLLTAEMWDVEQPDRPLTEKMFHVSPFMSMDQQYRWRLVKPQEQLSIQMEVRKGDDWFFDVQLMMKRLPLTRGNLLRMNWRFPWMALTIFARIYWQALRLWRKKLPFYPHPKKQRSAVSVSDGRETLDE